MKNDLTHLIGAFISGVLVLFMISKINFWLAWVCFVPFFYLLFDKSRKESFKLGFIFGSGISIFGFFWIITGTERFTGSSIIFGIAIFLCIYIFFSLLWAIIGYIYSALKVSHSRSSYSFLMNSLLMVSIILVFEFLLSLISHSMPWFAFYSGYGLMDNLYAIQPVAFLGLSVLSFIVIIINYSIAYLIHEKLYHKLYWPIIGIVGYLIIGYLILVQFENKTSDYDRIDIAILSENIPPEIRWDNNTGPAFVDRLIDLAEQAVLVNPDIALWSESAIPWTYRDDDDLVLELLRITESASINHILGMNTDYADNRVYNSTYNLIPGNSTVERYDKRFLLGFIEKPIYGLIFPFLSSGGFSVKKGDNTIPLNTSHGKAGIMICNEVVVTKAAVEMVNNGAQFLLNLSNDGWFHDTYIVPLHFYNARMRAVETRKDIVINSNRGISGYIKASGRIELKMAQTTDSFVEKVSIQPNDYGIPQFWPNLNVYLSSIVLISLFLIKFSKKNQ